MAEFVHALGAAGIPAGFVVFESDVFEKDSEGILYWRGGRLWQRRRLDDGQEVTLASAAATFRDQHPAYDIVECDGVLQIRARALGVVRPLERVRADRFRLDGVPASTAFNEAQRIADPAIPVRRGGYVDGFFINPDDPPPSLEELSADPPVRVDIADATLLDALNAIVKQVPGTVWVLSRHVREKGQYYTLAYRRSGGVMIPLDDPLR